MLALKKSWLFAIAICVAMITTFHGGHALDYFESAEIGCCSSSNSAEDSHDDEETHSPHECCQSSVAILVRPDLVVPLGSVALALATDVSFNGGMVKEIDYPPQLV